jgi:hypothetical protein
MEKKDSALGKVGTYGMLGGAFIWCVAAATVILAYILPGKKDPSAPTTEGK